MSDTDFDLSEWAVIFPPVEGGDVWRSYSVYSGTTSVVDGSTVEDVTAARIATVHAHDMTGGDLSETDLALLVELTDGTWAACMAWCDTTGWDCRSGVEWRWAPTRDLIVEQGLDREARRRLGVPLAVDADGAGAR